MLGGGAKALEAQVVERPELLGEVFGVEVVPVDGLLVGDDIEVVAFVRHPAPRALGGISAGGEKEIAVLVGDWVELAGHQYLHALERPPGLPLAVGYPEKADGKVKGDDVTAQLLQNGELDVSKHLEYLDDLGRAGVCAESLPQLRVGSDHDARGCAAADIDGDAIGLLVTERRSNPFTRGHCLSFFRPMGAYHNRGAISRTRA